MEIINIKRAAFKLTCVRTHGEVRRVVFPRLEVSGVLHRAVSAWRHPRSGAVNQRAPLSQEMVRRSEISAFHPGEKNW